jgi:hypothetical protein
VGRVSFEEVLRRVLWQLWPRQSQIELLLDLGENKGRDEREAAASVARWLHDELGLPLAWEAAEVPVDTAWSEVEALAASLPDGPEAPGVGRWVRNIASAVGSSPKTLSNVLGDGPRSARPDLRWLGVIDRIARGDLPIEAWSFHLRTRDSVARQLERLACPGSLDAGDALLVSSLLALWQRRRPTDQVRANRGKTAPRRSSPKSIVAREGATIQRGQLEPLAEISSHLSADRGRVLLLLAVEAALFEAHLCAHPGRRGAATSTGEPWFTAVEGLLGARRLIPLDVEILEYRIARMRAYRDRAASPSGEGAACAYVDACVALDAARRGEVERRALDWGAPGLFMLVPQLRSAGFTPDGQ